MSSGTGIVFFLKILAFGIGLAFFQVIAFIFYQWLICNKTDKTDKFNYSSKKKESIEEEFF